MDTAACWRSTSIKSVAKKVTVGFVGSQAPHFVDTGVPLLRGQNVLPGRLQMSNLKYISESTDEKWSKSSLAAGDVVIVRVGYPGVAAVVPENLGRLNAASLVIVRPDPDSLDPHFLAYLLNSPWGKAAVSARFVGSAQQVLNTNAVADLEVLLPPLALQQRIVEPLRALDGLIENNRLRVDALEEMARATYREWFVHFRYPGHDGVPLADSDLGPIPEGWHAGCAGDLVVLNKATVDPSTVEPGTPAVGLEHIPRRQITLDDWGRAGDLGSRKATFGAGDILFGKIRPYFHKVSVAPMDGICSTDAVVLRPDRVHWGQAVLAIASDEFVALAVQTSNGTKMPRADWKVIREFPVAIPPTSLARQFSEVAHGLLAQAQVLTFQARHLASLRDLLLPKLVAGEIDASHLDLDAITEAAIA